MRLQAYGGVQPEIVEIGRHAGFCMSEYNSTRSGNLSDWAMERSERDNSAKEVSRPEASDGVDGGIEGCLIVGDFADRLHADPKAITCALSPGRNPEIQRFGGPFASARRVPARMLSELSIAMTEISSLCGPRWIRALCKDLRTPARSENQQRAEAKQHQVAQPAVLDGALRAPLEKHQRAERQRRASCASAAGAATPEARRPAAPAKNHGVRNPI